MNPAGAALRRRDGIAGREASLIRRRQLSGGKTEIGNVQPTASQPAPGAGSSAPANDGDDASADGRWAAVGRSDRDTTVPARLGYPLKVVTSRTHSGQFTTGLRIGPGEQVTGDEDGAALPVTGNQYYGEETGSAVRARPAKVGATRTPGGLEVSGTLVRSKVEITGDERGDSIRITGEADQTLEDDLTTRSEPAGAAQFPRRTDPHGHNAASSEFLAGRSGQPVKSRRSSAAPYEITMKGHAVSGTAVGSSELMTGDEDGAARRITGTQYRASQRAATGAPALEPRAQGKRSVRLDPVTGAKVVEARTWGGQRVTGPAFEHTASVTGSEAGSYVATTGTPYQGPASVAAFLGNDAVPTAAERVVRRPAREAVTGDRPLNEDGVTGTQRGADRDITGTPYYRADGVVDASGNAIAEIDRSFSIASPQRRAQLRAEAKPSEEEAGRRVTGSFASGRDKITGAVEFLHTPRTAKREGGEPAVTGEGASAKDRITGDSWRSQSNVTGTEGYIASNRNPTQKGGKRHGFAGAMKFRPGRPPFEPEYDVTGILIDKEDAALDEPPRVTVSGGAAT